MSVIASRGSLRGVGVTIVGVVVLAALGIATGLASVWLPDYALLLALAVLLIAVAAIDMSLVPVLAVPGVFLVQRIGPMSGSDLLLGLSVLIALLLIRGRGIITMQPLLWSGAFYLALTMPQLILNRYAENYIEWLHEVALVLGAMVVGFVIGREGHARLALGLYVAICVGIGITAGVTALGNGFQPVYLGVWHKNAIGAFLMIGFVIALANPPWLGWPRWFAWTAVLVCAAGMAASQSRQAIVGALVGALIIGLRPRFHNGKRSRWMWIVLIPAGWFVYQEVAEQLTSDNDFSSAAQRLTWYASSIEVWLQSPLFGVGHRWWTTWHTGYGGFQPPNAELEVLTTVGILGLVGFLGMFAGGLWALARMNPVYGTLGLAVVAAKFAQGQFDLYWVAGHASLLWIIAGICYGIQERDRASGVERIPHEVQTVWRRTRGVRI
ncbi:O-antigen ligase [Microbacterium terrae]|uniref:O-antigen ligase family protein n=1 Tax=Microbacterium terrae TaxID=69369 RepID=UPI0012EE285E|nr:O-antigen ligase family protein [Microbacterium terrae]MBP1078582.1 O-antigen ligase [Microbacterium terrae]